MGRVFAPQMGLSEVKSEEPRCCRWSERLRFICVEDLRHGLSSREDSFFSLLQAVELAEDGRRETETDRTPAYRSDCYVISSPFSRWQRAPARHGTARRNNGAFERTGLESRREPIFQSLHLRSFEWSLACRHRLSNLAFFFSINRKERRIKI